MMKRVTASLGLAAVGLAVLAPMVMGQVPGRDEIRIEDPELYGLSAKELESASEVIQAAIDSSQIGSAVGLIARDGHIVFLRSYGMLGEDVPMTTDAICRLASITKTVTAAAVMKLIERKQVRLDDAVSKYLPDYRHVKVAGGANADGLTAPRTPMTVFHLLTHQSGIASDGTDYWGVWDTARDLQEFAHLIAGLPLEFHPGDRFHYGQMGSSYELLAAIVERVTGKSFAEFLAEEILTPLNMNDTYFFVPEAQAHRLSAIYRINENGELDMFRNSGEEEAPSQFFSGGGGLRSTVVDYFKFLQCLLNGGELEGKRILDPHSVELMTTNQVEGGAWDSDVGWGFGAAIQLSANAESSESVGSFGWNGGTGTIYSVDPVEKLIAILFIPSQPRTPHVNALRDHFVQSAYKAIEKPSRSLGR